MKKLRYVGDYAIIFVSPRLRLNLKKNDTFDVDSDEYETIFKLNKNFEIAKEEIQKKEDTKQDEIK